MSVAIVIKIALPIVYDNKYTSIIDIYFLNTFIDSNLEHLRSKTF